MGPDDAPSSQMTHPPTLELATRPRVGVKRRVSDSSSRTSDSSLTVRCPDPVVVTQPTCSARTADGGPCLGTPFLACPRCLLVGYCNAECRERHWATHRADCKRDLTKCEAGRSEDVEEEDDDMLAAESDSFWCKTPATDVLNLDKNEGRYYDDKLDLLFTGESSLRHLIYSVTKLPATASPKLNVAINEASNVHAARTLFALCLLTARDRDPVVNAEACIHMWYSAKMPAALHRHLQAVVRSNLGGTLDDVAALDSTRGVSPSRGCRLSWSLTNLGVQVQLKQSQWAAIHKYLAPVEGLSMSQAIIIRYVDTRRNSESPCRSLARMTKSRALGCMKWRDDGILLPFGHHRDMFDTLNPLFFLSSEQYPSGATSEPLCEWPMELLEQAVPPAANDVYGKMFYYLRDLLVVFQRRLGDLSTSFRLSCEPTSELVDWTPSLPTNRPFDRIEVGHHFDAHPLMTLVAFSNLVRHQDENPCATLLTITRDSVVHGMECVGDLLRSEHQDMYRPYNAALDELAPPASQRDKADVRTLVRRRLGLLMWRNWDKYASRFLSSARHFAFTSLNGPQEAAAARSVFQAGFIGLVVREKHVITRRWPNRLVHSKKDKPSERDFNRWLGWPTTVPLRWIEWKRSGDIDRDEWLNWMTIATSMSRLTFERSLSSIVEGGSSDDEAEAEAEAEAADEQAEDDDGQDGQDGQDEGGAGDEASGPAMKPKGKKKKKKGKKSKGKKKEAAA